MPVASVAAAVVARRVARPFVARRPFLDGPAARGFTTLIAPRILPAKVVPACIPPARIGATDVIPAPIVAAVAPAVRPGLVEADLPAAAAIAGVAVGLAEVAGITGIAGVAATARVLPLEFLPAAHLLVAARTRIVAAIIRQSGLIPARRRAPGGGPLLHHALLGTGIAAARSALRTLHRRPLGAGVIARRGTVGLHGPAGFLGGTRTLRRASAPFFGGLDDLGRGPS